MDFEGDGGSAEHAMAPQGAQEISQTVFPEQGTADVAWSRIPADGRVIADREHAPAGQQMAIVQVHVHGFGQAG